MDRSILTIEPVAKHYPRFETHTNHEVISKFYEVHDRAIIRGKGFVDGSERSWYETIDSFLSEGCALQ
jgi:hypothetical protein